MNLSTPQISMGVCVGSSTFMSTSKTIRMLFSFAYEAAGKSHSYDIAFTNLYNSQHRFLTASMVFHRILVGKLLIIL